MFDNLHLTNMLRSEVEHILETGFPLDVFPDKIQDVILNLARYENFNVEYTASIILSAVATSSKYNGYCKDQCKQKTRKF